MYYCVVIRVAGWDVQDASARAYELELAVRCGICLDVKDDLRLLPCLHSYCPECVSKQVEAASAGSGGGGGGSGGVITCPICKVPDAASEFCV